MELFALSASSCLHDIDKGLGTFKRSHGEVSAGEIRIHFSKYGLDAGEADIIGWIIKVHDHGDFSFDLPEDPIVIGALELNIKPLAALFRLADILHADYRRIDSAKAINPKDRARYCIRGWKYDAEGRIRFWADPDEIPDLEHIHRAVGMMRQDIEKIAPILRNAGYPYEISVTEIDESKFLYAAQTVRLSNRSFLGMDSFCEDDYHLFKGRTKESHELYQMLLFNDPITAIQDRSKDVRICTWKALARICTWKDISLLNSMLTSDISDVKVASAEALIRLGYHEGIAKLCEMLKDKGKNGQMALDALARLGDREIIPDLVKMIKDEDPIVKKGAARALGSLGSEEEVPVLLGIIVSESDINPDAKDALIFIDRKLYCPFNWNNKEK